MPLSPEEEFKAKLDVVKAYGDTAKSYIEISSAALALPILVTRVILGNNVAENGLRSGGAPVALYTSWACFLLAILFGLIYRWSSIHRVWDELHTLQRTDGNATKPGFRRTWWVLQFPNLNLSVFYGGMLVLFFAGALSFVVFAVCLLRGEP
jgi:hypothetical protein